MPTVDVTDEVRSQGREVRRAGAATPCRPAHDRPVQEPPAQDADGGSATGGDLDRMQGEWGIGELEANGAKIPADATPAP